MKKFFISLALLLVSVWAGAQEKKLPPKGFTLSVGVGAKYVMDRKEADFSPEVGFHYRLDAQNMFGLGLMYDAVSVKEDLFLSYTHDFLLKPASPYAEARLGVNNFLTSAVGGYVGVQGGYRFILGRKTPFRVGLSMDFYGVPSRYALDRRTKSISIGMAIRSEF